MIRVYDEAGNVIETHEHNGDERSSLTKSLKPDSAWDGRTVWIVDAHRGDGKRFIVHADEKLTAFLELQRAIHQFASHLLLAF